MDCLFCKIVDKSIPAKVVYEDEHIVAFDDIYPQAPQHKIIVPKKHIATINEMTEDDKLLIGHMMYTATQLAQRLNLQQDGYRLVMNCNEKGGQTVFHIHLHLLGGRQMTWPPG